MTTERRPRIRIRQPRGKGLRTRSGCLTCRKRHIKCDEAKPVCGPCRRIEKTCHYTTNSVEPQESLETRDSPASTSQQTSTCIGSAELDNGTQISQYQTDHHDQFAGVTTGLPDFSPGANTSDSVTSSTQFIDVATTRWFGMLAEDAEIELGIIDSPDFPAFVPAATQTLHSEAHGNETSTQSATPVYLSPGNSTSRGNEESFWRSSTVLTLQPHESLIFRNFVCNLSAWIDLFDPHKHFSTLVPRLALRNVGLLNAILALSVRHLSLVQNLANENPHERDDALKYYHQCLHYVRKAMRYDSYNTSLELLGTALMISAYEMLDGSRRAWEQHLQGVFWIQRSQIIHGDSKGMRAAVWWAWLCQDIWAAFRDKRKTFTFWKPTRTFDDLDPWELGARSVFLMSKVVSFCSQEETENTEDNPKRRIEAARTLDIMLDKWKSLQSPEFLPLPMEQETYDGIFEPLWIHPPTFGAAIQLYHAACILLTLHRPSLGGLNEYLEQQERLSHHVNNICGIAITMSDSASSIMSSQCMLIGELLETPRQNVASIRLLHEQLYCIRKGGNAVQQVKIVEHELK